MNSVVINIKTQPEIKKQAQKVAENLGLSLTAVINGFLSHLIKTKAIHFAASEEPTEYLLQALKESREDVKAGRVVSFKTHKDAVNYLDNLIKDEKRSTKSGSARH